MRHLWMTLLFSAGMSRPAAALTNQLLLLRDPEGVLSGAPTLSLAGAGASIQVQPRDDGKDLDRVASDGVYSGNVPVLTPGWYVARVEDGTRSLPGTFEARNVDTAQPILLVKVQEDVIVFEQTDPQAMGAGASTPSASAPPLSTASEVDLGGGLFLVLLVVGAVQVGFLLVGMRRAGRRGAVSKPAGDVAPLRITRDLVSSVVADLTPTHRLFVAGRCEASHPNVVAMEEGLLPSELVATVEGWAACPGLPVAVLIVDPVALDAAVLSDPLEDLASLVAGRFPLIAVGGPARWTAWRSSDPRVS